MSYREFPVYVPAGEDRLCSVVCSPPTLERDLGVVLLTGGNYTRSHRNRMWARAARLIAERGWPSIRIDYHGVGDSTGTARFDMEIPFDDDVLAATEFLQNATNVGRIAIVSTCFGGRSAVAAGARHPDARAVTIFPIPLLIPGTGRAPRFRSRVKAAVKRHEWGERLLKKPAVKRLRAKGVQPAGEDRGEIISPRFKRDLKGALERATVRFVYGEHTPHLVELRRCLAEIEPHLTAEDRARIELDIVEGTDLHRFQTLEDQDIVVNKTVASIEATWRALDQMPDASPARVIV